MWRAVVDQHLKDIIEHYLCQRNYRLYFDACKFFDEQLTGKGQECILALIEPEYTHRRVQIIEKLCRELKEKGVILDY